MILNENKIISTSVSNLEENFKELEKLVPKNNKDHLNSHNSLMVYYRDLIGRAMWLKGSTLEYERELVFDFLFLEERVQKFLKHLKENT